MAINYGFTVKGEGVTLNQMDSLLCEFQEIDVDEDRYCDLYQYIIHLVMPMFAQEIESIDKDGDFTIFYDALQGDLDDVVNAFKQLDIKLFVWRDNGPHIFN